MRGSIQKIAIIAMSIAIMSGKAGAQSIVTAEDFFDSVATHYGAINDYLASARIQQDGVIMEGRLSYRAPDQIRIDFDQPEDQTLVSNGSELLVYLPDRNLTLRQELSGKSKTTDGAGLATGDGLKLLRQFYGIAYLDGPEKQRLDEIHGNQLVTQLRLDWRYTSEGFRQILLFVDEELFIRRIVGTTVNFTEIQFDFYDIAINQGIPANRFEYSPPSSANTYDGFLFE